MNPLLALTLASLWVTATRGQSCQDECVTCEHLTRQAAAFSSLVCILECEGSVPPAGTWRWCREASRAMATRDAAALARALRVVAVGGAPPGSSPRETDTAAGPLTPAGGVVKRYGGFMRKGKKLNSAPAKAANDKRFSVFPERGNEGLRAMEEAVDAALGEPRAEAEEVEEEEAAAVGGPNGDAAPLAESKRYGGFYRRQRSDDDEEAADGSNSSSAGGGGDGGGTGDSGGGGGGHELEKRYGGFMRRLGRPSKKTGRRYESVVRQYMGLQEPAGEGVSEELGEEELQQQQQQQLHRHQVEEDDDKRFLGFVRS